MSGLRPIALGARPVQALALGRGGDVALELRPNCEIATRICRRILARRGSVPSNAHSARTASAAHCETSAPIAAAALRRDRSGRRGSSGRDYRWPSGRPPTKRVHLSYSREDVAAFAARLAAIPPDKR